MAALVRLRDASGASYNDPSPDVITYVVLGLDDENRFVVAERAGVAQTYAQAYRKAAADWSLEYRAGSAEQHFETVTDDPHQVVRFITDWCWDRPGWEAEFTWQKWIAR